MRYYPSDAERDAAIAGGEATPLNSTLQDGEKHYAVKKYSAVEPSEIVSNLTGTEQDNLPDAIREAERWDGAAGYAAHGAERIA